MMKKIIVTGATILMALIIAAPSFAIETKVTGTFVLDGVLDSNPGMASDDDDKETISYREMQLRLNTETQINDKIKFLTRVDILDKLLSSKESNSIMENEEDDDNIQFDRAWMEITSPVGLFKIGRKEGVKWGTDFYDDGKAYGTDRAEWIVPLDLGDGNKFYVVAVTEKALETLETNRDNDKFYITGTYVTKQFRTGLLLGYYNYNSNVQENWNGTSAAEMGADTAAFGAAYAAYVGGTGTLAALQAAGATLGGDLLEYSPRVDGSVFYAAPYFKGMLGPININAEFGYVTGELEIKPDAAAVTAANALRVSPYGKKDVDLMCYWVEAGYPIDKANIELGYAFMSGDKDGMSGDVENAGALGQGEDWEKVFILTGDDHGMDSTLGGEGNILSVGSDMNNAGMNLMYLSGSYQVNDSISLGGLFAYATADEAPTGYKDDYGMEMDLRLGVKFLGNLEYNVVAGYLMSGDFWKQGSTTKVDDVVALYHEIVLSF